jgi:MFS transporter, FHS family, Na+ dependent glucose transporter 1
MTGENSVGQRSTSYAYYVTFISLGMFAGMLGPSIDVFKERTGSTNGQIAILFTVMAIGYTVGGAFTGRLFDRRRGHPLIAAGLVGAAIAVLLMTKSSTLIALGVLMAAMGFSTSSVDAGGNTLLTWLHGDNLGPWMIGLHAAFGVGSAMAPVFLQVSRSATESINTGLVGMSLVGIIASANLLRRPSPMHTADDRAEQRADARNGSTNKPAPQRSSLFMAAVFFFMYVGLEIGFAGWVYTFARDRNFSEGSASALTSTFWWAFTAGRLIGIPIARRLSGKAQILSDVVVTMIGAGLLVVSSSSPALLWAGTIVLALGLATMFPAMINIANERVAVTGGVTSWFIGGAGAGSAVLPWIIGRLFDSQGSKILPLFVFIAAGLVAIVATTAARLFENV